MRLWKLPRTILGYTSIVFRTSSGVENEELQAVPANMVHPFYKQVVRRGDSFIIILEPSKNSKPSRNPGTFIMSEAKNIKFNIYNPIITYEHRAAYDMIVSHLQEIFPYAIKASARLWR